MLVLEEEEEMKKKHEQKSVFFRIEIVLANGIQKISVQNYGIFLMEKNNMMRILEYFLSQIGQN